MKSTKEVGYSFFSAGATTGMPILPVIGLGVTVDRAKDSGNYDIVKTTGSNILSSGLENKFGHYTGFPLIKETMTNSFEKYYEQLKEANKHEKWFFSCFENVIDINFIYVCISFIQI